MDDGRLTDGEGRTVDFSNAVVVMTSNLGAGKARRGIGFTAAEPGAQDDRMLAAAKSAFLPEFLNRIDEIVTFRPLAGEQVERITALICAQVAERLAEQRGIALEVETRSWPGWRARASTRSSAPARCCGTSGARWRRS